MSSEAKRYLVGEKGAGGLDPRRRALLDLWIEQGRATLVRNVRRGPIVVSMSPQAAKELAAADSELVVEEDSALELLRMPGLPPVETADAACWVRRVYVRDALTGAPVPGATIYCLDGDVALQTETDGAGTTWLTGAAGRRVQVIVSPRATYWSHVADGIVLDEHRDLEVGLHRLPICGRYGWGHRFMQFDQVHARWTGRGVSVAIVDSGVSDALLDFRPFGGHNTIDGADPRAWQVDEKGHGTHCAGIVNGWHNILGGAPGAEIYSIKIFPGGHLSDLVEAIEWCVDHRIDVVSLSLGSPDPSVVLTAALTRAHAYGVTVVAASGNHGGSVAFPAALPSVLGVGALGCFRTFPVASAHRLKIGTAIDRSGHFFAARFSSFGPGLDVIAPGVAIVSTVPSGYAAWDGTSMAGPMVTALCALVLEAYPAIRTGDAQQPEWVRAIVTGTALDLGLPPELQGSGLPRAVSALSAAAW